MVFGRQHKCGAEIYIYILFSKVALFQEITWIKKSDQDEEKGMSFFSLLLTVVHISKFLFVKIYSC